MKTLQELYTEVMNNDALKAEFLALTTPEQIVAFAEKNGCTATLEEIKSFFEEKAAAAGELSEEDLAQVAGGKGATDYEAKLSIFTLGLGCIALTIYSAAGVAGGRCGTAIEGEGLLCAETDYERKHKKK